MFGALCGARLITGNPTIRDDKDADSNSDIHSRPTKITIWDIKISNVRHLGLHFRLVNDHGFARNPTIDDDDDDVSGI